LLSNHVETIAEWMSAKPERMYWRYLRYYPNFGDCSKYAAVQP